MYLAVDGGAFLKLDQKMFSGNTCLPLLAIGAVFRPLYKGALGDRGEYY